jgi:hypothetical protein
MRTFLLQSHKNKTKDPFIFISQFTPRSGDYASSQLQSTTTILLFLVKFTDGVGDSFIELLIHLIRNDAGDNKVSRDVDHRTKPAHEPTEMTNNEVKNEVKWYQRMLAKVNYCTSAPRK